MRQTDQMDPARANALLTMLGRAPDLAAGAPLPPFFHQIYFWDPHPAKALGRDGHPRVGQGLIPDMGLPRRMWAGGQLRFHAPLRVGHPAEKHSECKEVTLKKGGSGPLAFVTLVHEVWQNGRICVAEHQDLVYRQDHRPDAPLPKPIAPPADAETRLSLSFDATQLFRYSALTLNGHRIHYDADYARDVEGYEGLVVHGPLLAQLMMLEAAEDLGALKSFTFRGAAALSVGHAATLCQAGGSYWIESDGRLIMQAEAQ